MNVGDQLLAAAARVYAEVGYRGATTRRIAQEAGVNEITLFREFGSKETLLHEAIARAGAEIESVELPDEPRDPVHRAHRLGARPAHPHARAPLPHPHLHGRDGGAPGIISSIDKPPVRAATSLADYLRRLRARKLATARFDAQVAATMLMGSLFDDAMGRGIMPEMFTRSTEASVREYVRLLLRGVGVAVDQRAEGE